MRLITTYESAFAFTTLPELVAIQQKLEMGVESSVKKAPNCLAPNCPCAELSFTEMTAPNCLSPNRHSNQSTCSHQIIVYRCHCVQSHLAIMFAALCIRTKIAYTQHL